MSPQSPFRGAVRFGPFRLDRDHRLLWLGEETVHLEPKAWEVLCFLAQHAGKVVSKDELLAAVWPEVAVTDKVLSKAIGQLRSVLQDDRNTPRYIATVHRRGYRFVAEIEHGSEEGTADGPPPREQLFRIDEARSLDGPEFFVGRSAALAQLSSLYAAASRGQRQIAFVTGDAGIGKTTLLERFASRLGQAGEGDGAWIAQGQCIERHGPGEAYLPVLEAVGQLARGPLRERLAAVLREHAPTWVVQIPGLVDAEAAERLRTLLTGTGSGRMLREIAGALEVLTAEAPLVLILEDLQWSDPATLDFLSTMAHHSGPARLLLLGTYRPIDVIVADHPLKKVVQTLRQRRQCEQITLDAFDVAEARDYCDRRFPGVDPSLAASLHARSDGNPLFIVGMADFLVTRDRLAQTDGIWQLAADFRSIEDVPDSLRAMIEARIDALDDDEQQFMAVASVAGSEFALPTVFSALGDDSEDAIENAEAACERLTRHWHLLRYVENRTWPDGTVAPYYEFAHALYRQVLYERVSPARRQRLHQQLGERLEKGFGQRTEDIAAELASHFQGSADHARAVTYLWQAAAGAGRRFVSRNGYLVPALHHLGFLPEGPDRDLQELLLRMNVGVGQLVHEGFVEGAEENFARTEALCARLGGDLPLAPALLGLWVYRLFAGHRQEARALSRELLQAGAAGERPLVVVVAHLAAAATALFEGQQQVARSHFEAVPEDVLGESAAQPRQADTPLGMAGADAVAFFYGLESWNLWSMGFADRARDRLAAAVALVDQGAGPISRCGLGAISGVFHLLLQLPESVKEIATELTEASRDNDYLLWAMAAPYLAGWAEARLGEPGGATGRLQSALRDPAGGGVARGTMRSLALLIVSESCIASGHLEDADALLDEALNPPENQLHGQFDAELLRRKGEVVLRSTQRESPGSAPFAPARRYFERAVELANAQGARMLELRATVSLCRLLRDAGEVAAARRRLTDVYEWFTEGFDTPDLRDAAGLLEELRGP